jgi:hypothetical protein
VAKFCNRSANFGGNFLRVPLKAASVVVTTIMTATQSAHVRRLLTGGHFTLVAVDEAGFTPGRITLYMICSQVFYSYNFRTLQFRTFSCTRCHRLGLRLLEAVLWIRIRIRMDPHYFDNLDPHPDPHPHQIKFRIRIRIRIHIKVISWIRNRPH